MAPQSDAAFLLLKNSGIVDSCFCALASQLALSSYDACCQDIVLSLYVQSRACLAELTGLKQELEVFLLPVIAPEHPDPIADDHTGPDCSAYAATRQMFPALFPIHVSTVSQSA